MAAGNDTRALTVSTLARLAEIGISLPITFGAASDRRHRARLTPLQSGVIRTFV
jgi:hypothetical protein